MLVLSQVLHNWKPNLGSYTHMLDPSFRDLVWPGCGGWDSVRLSQERRDRLLFSCSAAAINLTCGFTRSFLPCLCFTNSYPSSQVRGPKSWLLKSHLGACQKCSALHPPHRSPYHTGQWIQNLQLNQVSGWFENHCFKKMAVKRSSWTRPWIIQLCDPQAQTWEPLLLNVATRTSMVSLRVSFLTS